MSLTNLAEEFRKLASQGSIIVEEKTFRAANLEPPPKLNELICNSLRLTPDSKLVISTSVSEISEPGNDTLTITGRSDFLSVKNIPITIQFNLTDQLNFTLIAELGEKWKFENSFPGLEKYPINDLPITNTFGPNLIFSTCAIEKWSWNDNTDIAIEKGLNFAAYLRLSKYLKPVLRFIPSFDSTTDLPLFGTIDPQKIDNDKIIFPDVNLKARIDYKLPRLFFLEVSEPYIGVGMKTIEKDLFDDKEKGEEEGIQKNEDSVITIGEGKNESKQIPVVYFGLKLNIDNTFSLDLQASIIPDSNTFNFLVKSDPEKQLTCANLSTLMADQSLFEIVPEPLYHFLDSIAFKRFCASITLNEKIHLNSLTTIVGSSSSAQPWEFFDGFKIDGFEIVWSILSPETSKTEHATFEFQFEFFPTIFRGKFTCTMSTDLLIMGMYQGSVSLNELIAGITNNTIVIPDNFMSIVFSDFDLILDIKNKAYSFGASADINLNLLHNKIELEKTRFELNVISPGIEEDKQYFATMMGILVLDKLSVFLSANYDGEQKIWSFKGSTLPDDNIEIGSLLKRLFNSIGVADIIKPNIMVRNIGIELSTSSDSEAITYSISGELVWEIKLGNQDINMCAQLELRYDGNKSEKKQYAGTVKADIVLEKIGAKVTLGYMIEDGNQELMVEWNGFEAKYNLTDKKIKFRIDHWSFGKLLEGLVNMIDPDSGFELDAPWNLLNHITLDGFELIIDLENKKVSVAYDLRGKEINLGFVTIKKISLEKTDDGVDVSLKAKFLADTQYKELAWDAVNDNPPTVPGQTGAFDLRLLAMGHHVTIANLSEIGEIKDAIKAMKSFGETGRSELPVKAGSLANQPVFDENSNWLIGMHFFLMKGTLELMAIFNDPNLYGLRICLNGEKAKIFNGLEFEIMYKKISDSIGVYQLELKLPDKMRYLQFGAVSVVLPVVGIEIYTNGNFKIDFGFPYEMNFERSFTVQLFPFTGSGGFYLAVLNGATSSKVPETNAGNFNPVVEFGFGLKVGFGKSFNKGILKADFSITIVGILEGVIAAWHPYEKMLTDGNSNKIENSYYYWIQGSIGIVGKLNGAVNFAIIKAEVAVVVHAYIQITIEAYRPVFIYLEAGVSVALRVKINLGLFKITIKLSFSTTIHESFTLGHRQIAPWDKQLTSQMEYAGLNSKLLQPNEIFKCEYSEHFKSYVATMDWRPLFVTEKIPFNLYFAPHLTISGENAAHLSDQHANFVAMLYTKESDFEKLAEEVFIWLTSVYTKNTENETQEEHRKIKQIDRETQLSKLISLKFLQTVYNHLSDKTNKRLMDYNDIRLFLSEQFIICIKETDEHLENATVFPMIPELELFVPSCDQSDEVRVRFDSYSMCTEEYLDSIQEYLNQLMVEFKNELDVNDKGGNLNIMFNGVKPITPRSMATFIFEDYFQMIAQHTFQAAIDALKNYKYKLREDDQISDILEWAKQFKNEFTLADLVKANKTHPLKGNQELIMQGLEYQIQSGDSLARIAQLYSTNLPAIEPVSIAKYNQDREVLHAGTTITIHNCPYNIEPRDTFRRIADKFQITVTDIANDTKDLPDIFIPLSVIVVPPVSYVTVSDNTDTLQSIARKYNMTELQLAECIYTKTKFYHGDEQSRYINLPDLERMSTVELLNTMRLEHSLSNLSGMVARFLLHGLRLPINDDISWDSRISNSGDETCALYKITGQQFTLPQNLDNKYEIHLLKALPKTISATVFETKISRNIALEDQKYINSIYQYQTLVESYELKDNLSTEESDKVRRILDSAGFKYVDWITFSKSSEDELLLKLTPDAIKWKDEVLNTAINGDLKAEIFKLMPMPLYAEHALRFGCKVDIPIQYPETLSLPINNSNGQIVATPVIWRLPLVLMQKIAQQKKVAPKFSLRIGTHSDSCKPFHHEEAKSYGWGTLIDITIKQIPVKESGPEFIPNTYEILGTDEKGISLIENILLNNITIHKDDIYILYPPNMTEERPQGLRSDGMRDVSCFIVQANLSTETHPEKPVLLSILKDLDSNLTGILNDPASDFIKFIWECSIVRTGGYYLYYSNLESKQGLPDNLFERDETATISLLIISPQIDGLLHPFINCAITNENISSDDIVFVQSEKQTVSYTVLDNDTINSIAGQFHIYPGDLALQNETQPLSPNNPGIKITDIYYQVKPEDTLETISAYFGVSIDEIKKQNKDLNYDWDNLQTWQLLKIPDLCHIIKPDGNLKSLADIAKYYSVSISNLVAMNGELPNIFPVGVNLQIVDEMVTKVATLPPGCTGFQLVRNNPGAKLDEPKVFLETQYNLLGYKISEGNAFFNGSNEAMPIGPLRQETSALNNNSTDEDDDTLPWTYEQMLPVFPFAKFNSIKNNDDDLPVEQQNPYAGVGDVIQLYFNWQDLFGNRTITPLTDPKLNSIQPLNNLPIKIGYTDKVIGLEQWPGVISDYWFENINGKPSLVMSVVFDPVRYKRNESTLLTAHGDQVETWKANALADRQLFKMIYYQINQIDIDDKSTITFKLKTSLDMERAHEIIDIQLHTLKTFVNQCYRYLDSLINNDIGKLPEAILLHQEISDFNNNDIFELTTCFGIYRQLKHVDDNFKDDRSVLMAETLLNPRVEKVANDNDKKNIEKQNNRLSLVSFAKRFEETFCNEKYLLKITTGYSRKNVAANEQSKKLWVIRFAKDSNQGISYQAQPGSSTFFAPKPLNNSPISRKNVRVYNYDPQTGIDEQNMKDVSFTNIDLDIWAQHCLEAIDLFLSPHFIIPAYIVDKLKGKNYVDEIIKIKHELAEVIAKKIDSILMNPEYIENSKAVEKLKQQLLIKLSNAYSISAISQIKVDINSNYHEGNNEYDVIQAPKLYGQPIPSAENFVMYTTKEDDTLADIADKFNVSEDSIKKLNIKHFLYWKDLRDVPVGTSIKIPTLNHLQYSISSAKIPLKQGSQYLDFTFSTRKVKAQKHFIIDLAYQVTHIEHQIGPIPGIEDYLASSWLSFVIPLKPMKIGMIDIPIVLREYPPLPSLIGQRSKPVDFKETDPAEILKAAKSWDYQYIYSQMHAAQDLIHSHVEFNLAPDFKIGASLPDIDLFTALARFITVYPEIQQVFIDSLPKINLESNPESVEFKQTLSAIESFLKLIEILPEKWSDWSGNIYQNGSAAKRFSFNQESQQIPVSKFDFKILEENFLDDLVITIKTDSELPKGLTLPEIVFNDFTAEPIRKTNGKARDKNKVRYRNKEGKYLKFSEALEKNDRIVSFPNIDILAYQNAWSSIMITRNEELIAGNPTNHDFVYQTPVVRFANKLTPLLDTNFEIDIAKIHSKVQQQKKLGQHLETFFKSLFDGLIEIQGPQSQMIKFECQYEYVLNDTISSSKLEPNVEILYINIPVLLATPFLFKIPNDSFFDEDDTNSLNENSSFVQKLSRTLIDWFKENRPHQSFTAKFKFDISIFSNLSDEKLPLIRLRNVTIQIRLIKDI